MKNEYTRNEWTVRIYVTYERRENKRESSGIGQLQFRIH